jgi:predicted RNA-binding Zn-ribbon protein involved in translation (DUF1610 family)
VQEQVRAAGTGELQPTDIIFECPQCGKSLAIDVRGAGYLVKCPDCGTQLQVPGFESEEEGASAPVPPPAGDLAATVQHLERLRALDHERLQQVSGEVALIQASLDRIVGLLEDASVNVKTDASE